MQPSYHTMGVAVNGTIVLTASITQFWGLCHLGGSLGAKVGVKWGKIKAVSIEAAFYIKWVNGCSPYRINS